MLNYVRILIASYPISESTIMIIHTFNYRMFVVFNYYFSSPKLFLNRQKRTIMSESQHNI